MNNDLISREALKEEIEEQRKSKVYSEADERQNVIIDCILYIIDNAPTVKVESCRDCPFVEEKDKRITMNSGELIPLRNSLNLNKMKGDSEE